MMTFTVLIGLCVSKEKKSKNESPNDSKGEKGSKGNIFSIRLGSDCMTFLLCFVQQLPSLSNID